MRSATWDQNTRIVEPEVVDCLLQRADSWSERTFTMLTDPSEQMYIVSEF